MKRLLLLPIIAALFAGLTLVPTASSAELELTFNIAEARAYAYRVSLNEEVFRFASPCTEEEEKTDPYCDEKVYNQTPNCPVDKRVEIAPEPPPGIAPLTGGADFRGTESGNPPHKANPVKINELVAIGNITKAGPFVEAGGFSSDTFTDNSGRNNPLAHAESDAVIFNKNRYEERCDQTISHARDEAPLAPEDANSYVHVLTRSNTTPESYNLSECVGDNKCSDSAHAYDRRPSAERAFSIVHLFERNGKIFGRLKAFVSDLRLGSGAAAVTVESMTTYVAFESDGTAKGLKWSAVSSASGVTAFGTPVPLQSGRTIEAPGGAAFIGVVGPYVVSNQQGTQLLIVAPGLFYSTEQQTTYVAGSVVRAGFNRAPTFSFSASNFSSGTPGLGLFRPGPGTFGEGGEFTDPAAGLPLAPELSEPPTLSIRELASTPWPLASMIAFGGLALLLLLAGWMQRFGWARKLFDLQPLRSINWMYRAFVRT